MAADDEIAAVVLKVREAVARIGHRYPTVSRAADDAVSQTILKLYEMSNEYDPSEGAFAAWLFAVTRYCTFKAIYTPAPFRSTEASVSLPDVPDRDHEPPHVPLPLPELVEAFLAQLDTPDERALFVRRFVERRGSDFIQTELGLSSAALNQRVTRLRAKLRTFGSENLYEADGP